jgi:hypothetical protein
MSALRSDIFCTTMPECSSSTSIDHLLDGLEERPVLVLLHHDRGPRHAELEALAAHGLDQDGELAARRGRDEERVLVGRFLDPSG